RSARPGAPRVPPKEGLAPADSLKRRDTRDFLPQDEGVDVVRTLVGEDRLQIAHVAHHRVLEGDPVAAENVAAVAGNLEGRADVVAFDEAHVLGPHLLLALEA